MKPAAKRIVHDYGMVLVLLALCAFFSVLTYREQPTTGAAAGSVGSADAGARGDAFAGSRVEVIGVQAAGAATIHDAWRAARRESGGAGAGAGGWARHIGAMGPPVTTFAEGLATRSVYELTFGALCEGLADLVTVSDEEMAAAMRLMLRATHNLCEPAGAAGLAALLKLRSRLAGRRVVIVNCGANVDQRTLRAVVAGGE